MVSTWTFHNCSVRGPGAGYDAFDPTHNFTYATDTSSVVILNASTPHHCRVAHYVSLPSSAVAEELAFDAANGKMYVADSNLGQVYVLDGTRLVATIASVPGVYGITYDPVVHAIITAANGGKLYAIVGTKVVKTLALANLTGQVIYSTAGRTILTSYTYRACATGCPVSTGLYAFSGTNLSALGHRVGKILISPGASGPLMAYDPANKQTYVCEGGKLFAVTLLSGGRVANVSIPITCNTMAYSTAKPGIYVVSQATNQIVVVRGTSVVATFYVSGTGSLFCPAYDVNDHDMFVTNGFGTHVYVVPT